MDIRTDLALESFSADELPDSVHISFRGSAFRITEIISRIPCRNLLMCFLRFSDPV